jgi:SNF2 family DNA or RNA helicase
VPNPGTREKIKEEVHKTAFIMSRKEANVGSKKLYNRRTVEMTPDQRRLYVEVFKKFQFEYIETNYATVRDVWLARLAGGFSPDRENPELLNNSKTAVILDLLQGDLKHEQVVVWFRFNEELTHVTTTLNKKGIPTTSFNGSSDRAERFRARDAFQSGKYRVICGQIQVGKFSMNLSAASTAIYYSNSYEAEARSQSEDRIVHVTKAQPLLYVDLVTKHSIDEAVVAALRDKNRDSQSFNRRLQRYMVEEFRRQHGLDDQEEGTPAKARVTAQARRPRQETSAKTEGTHGSTARIFPRSKGV